MHGQNIKKSPFRITIGESAPPKPSPAPVKQKDADKHESRYMIQTHSWFQTPVNIPIDGEFTKAVIYELVVEPFNRVSFVCDWVDNKLNDSGKVYSMTYTPQFLTFFNNKLPNLTLDISPEDWKTIPNNFTISNVIEETNTMIKFSQ